MIAAKEYNSQELKRAYTRRSWVYSKTVAPMERVYHQRALEQANIQPGKAVLEVAVGPGLTFVELAKRVGHSTTLYGIDLASGMLQLTAQRMRSNGFHNFDLKEADSRRLPFEDNRFDVVYNGYMLDLIPEADIPAILAEFKRVLKPGGRLVLLNMSKANQSLTLREVLYQKLPAKLTLYLMGGCRPVFVEQPVRNLGFQAVSQTFWGGRAPSELVMATKPA
jgi:demethylmenaquinone methyltransferase/2-methoxy-6-polyprenyl-1,4-benzoquinol methylase